MQSLQQSYLPARVVEGADRWYILFYQTDPAAPYEGRKRFRPTYDLNLIRDINERRKVAVEIRDEINSKLKDGWPFNSSGMSLLEAINKAKDIKVSATKRDKTAEHYTIQARLFIQYLKEYKLEKKQLKDFTRADAVLFLDRSRVNRNLKNRTINNYRDNMRALFNELIEREYLTKNPFCDIQKKRNESKGRRAFSDYEKGVLAAYINQHDKMLMLGILLQYHCFIRPVELTRLRFYHINLEEGLIRIEGDLTKNHRDAILTIPDCLMPYLKEWGMEQYDQSWFIFGRSVRPHATLPIGKNSMNRRHSEVLKKLKSEGKLNRIEGLSFYSWKDTGAMELFKRKVNILEIMKQLRHERLDTTQAYCTSLYVVNEEIKALDNSILPLVKLA